MLTLLVVEDNYDIRENLVELLSYLDLFEQIYEATTGTEAIEIIKTQQPSIVLCDIGLRDVDGRDVFKAIKSESSLTNKPIFFFLSASPDKKAECLALGADGFFEKPWKFKEIQNKLLQFKQA